MSEDAGCAIIAMLIVVIAAVLFTITMSKRDHIEHGKLIARCECRGGVWQEDGVVDSTGKRFNCILSPNPK